MVDNDFTKEQLISEYSEKLMDGSAALFAGAGLSMPAGFVNWKDLLRGIATDLGLAVDREYDLIAVAQYHENRRGNRTRLNEKLIVEFTRKAQPTENHRLIAQLPIHTVWTTNYDQLFEAASSNGYDGLTFKSDVLGSKVRRGDPLILKVHGDVDENLSRSGLSFTILRPHAFFQNTMMSAATIAGQGVLYGTSADIALSMIDSRDVALAAASLLTGNGHSGRIYDLTGSEAITNTYPIPGAPRTVHDEAYPAPA